MFKVFSNSFFITQNKKPYQAELVKITENIYTPKQVGQYQYGLSRWLTNKEKDKEFAYFILNPKDENIKKLIKNGEKAIEKVKKQTLTKKEETKNKENKGANTDEEKSSIQKQQDIQNVESKNKQNYICQQLQKINIKVKEKKTYAENMVNEFKDKVFQGV